MTSIGVAIPAYQAERYLGEAIDSVLAQTRPPDEIVVVDDGSTDRTSELTTSFGSPVRLVSQEHLGIGAARNLGVASLDADLVAMIDADDVWLPAKLERQLEALRARPDLDVVCCHVEEFVSPDLDAATAARLRPRAGALPGAWPGAMLARRSAVAGVGAWRTDLRVGPDVDWFARLRESGAAIEILPDALVRRRLHADNNGIRERAHLGSYLTVAKESLDRRRGTT